MGLFYSAPKPTTPTPSKKDLGHHGEHSVTDERRHHVNQYGSAHGEINWREYQEGVHHEIHKTFRTHRERETIDAFMKEQFDNSPSNRRHVLDRKEADAIVGHIREIYSDDHAKKLQDILNRRLQ